MSGLLKNGAVRALRPPMTEGPVGPILWRMTVPVTWGILGFIGYRLAEAWFVGRLGPQALAAISFAFPVTMIVMSLSIGLGAGTSSVIARALGAGEAGVDRLVADSLLLTFAVGVVAATVGMALADDLAVLLGAGPDVAPLIAGYFRVWFPASVLFLVGSVGLSAARAAGDARFQGTAMALASLVNLVLAPFCILGGLGPVKLGHGWGLLGAPLSSALAYVPLSLATLWRLRSLGILSFARLNWAAFAVSAARILRVGGPAAATNTVIPFSAAIITRLLSHYGHDVVAGFGLGSRVEALAMVPFFALSAVMNPFAGQNAGARKPARVRQAMVVTAYFCGALGVVFAVLLFVGRAWIANRFTHAAGVTGPATLYLALVPLSYGPAGMIAIVNAAFNGLNRPLSAVTVSVARTLVVNVPVAWLGGHFLGVPGVFLGICFSNLAVGVVSFIWLVVVLVRAEAAVQHDVTVAA